jgi:hypothetical protein
MIKAQHPQEMTLKNNNSCQFTVVREMKFAGLFDALLGYNIREWRIEVAVRRVLMEYNININCGQ